MTTVRITDAGGQKPAFTQWDVDRVLYITGVTSTPCLHFANAELKRAIVVEAEESCGKYTCKVPNFILQFALPVIVSVFTQPAGGEGRTEATVVIGVQPKKKPQDYTYEENIGYINWVTISTEAEALLAELREIAAQGVYKGDDGFSPTVASTEIAGGHRLTITDVDGTRTVDVLDGADGEAPTVSLSQTAGGVVITVSDGDTTSTATVYNGTATDEQVADWLDEHPEATTTVEDGSITHPKLADDAVGTDNIIDKAVTFEKTDFYYKQSKKFSPSWLIKPGGYYGNMYAVGRRLGTAMETVADEWPEVLSIVVPFTVNSTPYYIDTNASYRITVSSDTYEVHHIALDATVSEIVIGDRYYKVIKITRESFLATFDEAYEYDNPEVNWGSSGQPAVKLAPGGTNITQLWNESVVIDGEVDATLIAHNYNVDILSEDFVEGVHAAMASEDSSMSDAEATAKLILNGKVLIAFGDSYTAQMSSQYQSLANKYGMIIDNRGIVSSSFCGTYDSATGNGTGFKPMWKRIDTIISEYTNGYTINDVTYHVADVGLIVVMGGANDGFSISNWIGSGINDTDGAHIYGAGNHIFNVAQKTFTNAYVICVTQPSSYNRVVADYANNWALFGFDSRAQLEAMDDIQLSNYAMALKERAIKEVAWAYGVPVLDMFTQFPTMFNPSNRSTYWNNDKLHLKGAGYNIIKNALDKKIVEVVAGG